MPTHTILHPQLEVNVVTYFHSIPTSICTRKKAKKVISRQLVCLTDSYYGYIFKEIFRRDKIDFERYAGFYSDDEED